MIKRIKTIHSADPDSSAANEENGAYNPSKGVFYYFSDSGNQLRKMPRYKVNKEKEDADLRNEACTKKYPQVGKQGFGYMFFWLCPSHGHVYGGHMIVGGEGRKDPFSSLYKFCETAPEIIFYDNACQFSEYSLTREPKFFRNSLVYHDAFHSYAHICSKTFKSKRIPSLKVNTIICGQFNAGLKSIRTIASHLSQAHFMFLVQLYCHFWNKKKTLQVRKQHDLCRQFLNSGN